ncbi:MAG: purine nucleoside phosphorylase [Verrucomicrobiaceae bacterium]|nr:purine nucleoside phosphorylase [Verrucomicrobiaceae bacterium]MDB6116957.1 purine nucleoside phosphorylase [Verrucomicrobiaceae bacterium]
MHELGVRTLLLTNAAGCLNTDFTPGEHMLISDHLNLTGTSPLMGGPRFHDMSQMYSPRLDDVCKRPLSAHGFLYTPASTRGSLAPGMRRRRRSACSATLGADAVGMSTVLEAIQARALDIEVAELSSLTTWAAGITTEPVRHEEVLAMGRALIPQLVSLIRALACPH